MLLLFTGALLLIVFGAVAIQFFLKMRSLEAARTRNSPLLAADRYRPMLRLLSDDDLAVIPADSTLRREMRSRRRELFRAYLRCLTRDYGFLLAGVREAMLQSGVDRPDLARALAKNRMLFAMAICKVEFRLALHATGVGTVEISGLVEALETLRTQVNAFTSVQTAA